MGQLLGRGVHEVSVREPEPLQDPVQRLRPPLPLFGPPSSLLRFRFNGAAKALFFALLFFDFKDLFFGPLRAFAFPAFDFGNAPGFAAFLAFGFGFELVRQNPARTVAVHGLGPLLPAFYNHAAGHVFQNHARGNLVHILAAGTSGTDKRLFEVRFADAKVLHVVPQGFIFFQGYREHEGYCIRLQRMDEAEALFLLSCRTNINGQSMP